MPDLFKAAVAGVPFVDIMVTMSDPSIPLTIGIRFKQLVTYIRNRTPTRWIWKEEKESGGPKKKGWKARIASRD